MKFTENTNKIIQRLKDQDQSREFSSFEYNGKWVYGPPEMLNFSSNDYLGIASDSNLQNEFLGKCQNIRFGASSSRLLAGNHPEYSSLERTMAKVYQKEACMVYNSGYHANMGTLQAIAGKKDLILADKLVHASIIDGARLSEATFMRYRHLDYVHLEELLKKNACSYENVWIVSESVFSMDGDMADLRALVALKNVYANVMLYVDEAHAVGVIGNKGLGLCEADECISEIEIIVGTFGKALGSVGAFVLCDAVVKEYLVNTSRSMIFSTALPPVNIAWSEFAFLHSLSMVNERRKLLALASLLRNELGNAGFELLGSSQIIPVVMGENKKAIELADYLQRNGFFVLPVRPPTVPEGKSRIRISLRSDLDAKDVEELIRTTKKYLRNES